MSKSGYDNKFLDFIFGNKVQTVCYFVFAICMIILAFNHATNGEFLRYIYSINQY